MNQVNTDSLTLKVNTDSLILQVNQVNTDSLTLKVNTDSLTLKMNTDSPTLQVNTDSLTLKVNTDSLTLKVNTESVICFTDRGETKGNRRDCSRRCQALCYCNGQLALPDLIRSPCRPVCNSLLRTAMSVNS